MRVLDFVVRHFVAVCSTDRPIRSGVWSRVRIRNAGRYPFQDMLTMNAIAVLNALMWGYRSHSSPLPGSLAVPMQFEPRTFNMH